MSKYLSIWTTLLLITASAAFASDLQDGFRSIAWGTPATQVENLQPIYHKGETAFYVRPGEQPTINDVAVGRVVYGFYQQKFFAVYLNLETPETYAEIRNYLSATHGLPRTSLTVDQRIHIWKEGSIKIKLKNHTDSGRQKLAYYYTPLSNKLNESQQEQAHERSLQFLPIDKDQTPDYFPLLKY